MNLRKGLFSIPTSDPDNYGVYEGYTFGETWNGFECPLFEKHVAIKILKDCGYRWLSDCNALGFFDPDCDKDIEECINGEFESIPFHCVEFDGHPLELFDMSLGWVWEEETNN